MQSLKKIYAWAQMKVPLSVGFHKNHFGTPPYSQKAFIVM